MKGICQRCGLENKDIEIKEMTKSSKINIPNTNDHFEFESRKIEGWECEHCRKIHELGRVED